MTFKHVKFQDSAVMRSLERVAKEKGLVKEEDLVKNASLLKKADLTPSSNLLENLLKLSAGLREAGFDKYADDLENKTFAYRKAQTLYETSPEEGEDLVDAAHPDGSHKLEDVDGDEATVETIVDQQKKDLKMVEKEPTGKLASSKDILSAVKRALAGGPINDKDTGLSQAVVSNITNLFTKMNEIWSRSRLLRINSEGAVAYNRLQDNFYKYINSKTINTSTIANINGMIDETIKGLMSRQFWGSWGLISDDAEEIVFHLKSLKNYVNDTVVDDHKKLVASEPKPDEAAQKFNAQIDSYLATLKNWAAAVNNDPENSPEDKAQAGAWINERIAELNDLKSKFKPEEAGGFLIALNKSRFARESGQFKKIWIG